MWAGYTPTTDETSEQIQASRRTCKILWNITCIQDPGSTIVTCANLLSLTHPLITVKDFIGKNSLPCGAIHQLLRHILLFLPSLSSYTIETLPSYFSPALLLPRHSELFRWLDLNSQNIEMPLGHDKEISFRGGQEKLGSRVDPAIAENTYMEMWQRTSMICTFTVSE